MRSNYKVLTGIDLSNNDIYNVSEIIGNDYSNISSDLSIHTRDSDSTSHFSTIGNLLLRAGVSSSNAGGYVHLFAGLTETSIPSDASSGYGIKLFPDRRINVVDNTINVWSNETSSGLIDVRVNSNVTYDDSSDSYITLQPSTLALGASTVTSTSSTTYIKADNLIDINSTSNVRVSSNQIELFNIRNTESGNHLYLYYSNTFSPTLSIKSSSESFTGTYYELQTDVASTQTDSLVDIRSENLISVHAVNSMVLSSGSTRTTQIVLDDVTWTNNDLSYLTSVDGLQITAPNLEEVITNGIEIHSDNYHLNVADTATFSIDNLLFDVTDFEVDASNSITLDSSNSFNIISTNTFDIDVSTDTSISLTGSDQSISIDANIINYGSSSDYIDTVRSYIDVTETDVSDELIIRSKYWKIATTNESDSVNWDDSDELENRDFYLRISEESTESQPNVLAIRNLKVNGAINAQGFGVYWDDTTNSLIFTEGNIAWQ